jgi:hypothetical protein
MTENMPENMSVEEYLNQPDEPCPKWEDMTEAERREVADACYDSANAGWDQ